MHNNNSTDLINQSKSVGLYDVAEKIDFHDQTVLITGAAAGIGAALVRMAHQYGAHVIALDIQEDALKSLSDEFNGKRITTIPFDLSKTDSEDYKKLAEDILSKNPNGEINAFIMNAGVVQLTKGKGISNTPAWEFEKLNQINALSNADIFREIKKQLADDARLVLTSSPIVGRADVNTPGYAMSKALMEDVANQMMADLEDTNAKVTGWVPPPVQNFLRADLKPNEPLHAHPHGVDIAELPIRLASETLSERFNGQVVAMGYDHLRKKDGKTPEGHGFDYMPRAVDGGFSYDLRTRPLASGGGDDGEFFKSWSTASSRRLQEVEAASSMNVNHLLKDEYAIPEHIKQHRNP